MRRFILDPLDDQPFPARDWDLAVFGERERQVLIERGLEPSKLHVTGAAHWDVLYSAEAQLSKSRARQELGVEIARLHCVLPDFRYQARDASGIAENEICPVFCARTVGPVIAGPDSDMDPARAPLDPALKPL